MNILLRLLSNFIAFFFFFAILASGIDLHVSNNWTTRPDFVLRSLLKKFFETFVIATFFWNLNNAYLIWRVSVPPRTLANRRSAVVFYFLLIYSKTLIWATICFHFLKYPATLYPEALINFSIAQVLTLTLLLSSNIILNDWAKHWCIASRECIIE